MTRREQPWVGKARANYGSFYLWGDVPALMPRPYKASRQGGMTSGTKQPGLSGPRENGKGDAWFQDGAARHGSKSNARKAASAQIAKIPIRLSRWIAAYYKTEEQERVA